MNKQRILFVDDDARLLQGLKRALRCQLSEWEMVFIPDSLRAWEYLQSEMVDSIVSDIRMPGLTGLELLQRIKDDQRLMEIPVVILTGEGDTTLKRRALDLGAQDLLNKPVDRLELIARLRNVLQIKTFQDELREHNEQLEAKVKARTNELLRSQLEIVWRLGKAAEYRDEETGNHVIRVGCLSRALAEEMGMSQEFVETLFLAAPLHDIGKIGIPDSILRKPGPLTPEEREVMNTHCDIGEAILHCDIGEAILQDDCKWAALIDQHHAATSFVNPVLEMASRIAVSHHEKWDGSGYPNGLSGEDIPLESRIVALADVFDALRSKRPYKRSLSWDETLGILEAGSGSHFDPKVHQAFLAIKEKIYAIEEQFSDHSHSEALAKV